MTDASKIKTKKDALREFKRRRRVPWFAFLGFLFFSINIFTAIERGTVYVAWPPRFLAIEHRGSGWLSVMSLPHQDYPGVYIFILSLSVVAVPFFGAMLYSYYLKKIPD
jgi:hypothetical protein